TVGLYHLAWEVDTLDDLDQLRTKLVAADALTGQSDHGTTKSLYGHDPDGIELEVVWIVPAALIDARALAAQGGRPQPLDLAGEKARFGATTKGGIGISSPAH
ncbi:MAG: VOC family protein, partial [Acidimicrobiales bacterium]